jgi:hypothetical protein
MANSEPPNANNAPDVLAYRVGQLEIAVSNGFKELKAELSSQKALYATKVEVVEAKTQAHEEHERIWNEIKRVDGDVKNVQTSVDDMAKGNISFSFVQKIVFGLVAIILLAIANSVVRLAAEHI